MFWFSDDLKEEKRRRGTNERDELLMTLLASHLNNWFIREGGGGKARADATVKRTWMKMTIKNINRVKRRSHLDNRFIGEETEVFEGLQSLWIAKPGKMFYIALYFNEIFLLCSNRLYVLWLI